MGWIARTVHKKGRNKGRAVFFPLAFALDQDRPSFAVIRGFHGRRSLSEFAGELFRLPGLAALQLFGAFDPLSIAVLFADFINDSHCLSPCQSWQHPSRTIPRTSQRVFPRRRNWLIRRRRMLRLTNPFRQKKEG